MPTPWPALRLRSQPEPASRLCRRLWWDESVRPTVSTASGALEAGAAGRPVHEAAFEAGWNQQRPSVRCDSRCGSAASPPRFCLQRLNSRDQSGGRVGSGRWKWMEGEPDGETTPPFQNLTRGLKYGPNRHKRTTKAFSEPNFIGCPTGNIVTKGHLVCCQHHFFVSIFLFCFHWQKMEHTTIHTTMHTLLLSIFLSYTFGASQSSPCQSFYNPPWETL